MKLYYAGDVHGSEKCWRKFLNAARFYEVDTLIMGGDITGKLMVPVVANGNGKHQAQVLGRPETVADDGLEELEKRVRFNGFYPYRCDRDEYQRLESDRTYRDQVFTRLMVVPSAVMVQSPGWEVSTVPRGTPVLPAPGQLEAGAVG
mgnify:CR=1 FL=1